MTITVSAKGQMVIPAAIRKRYGIKSQGKVELVDLGKEIVIVPIKQDALKESRGVLKGITTLDLIRQRRKERKLEHLKK
jgi:AbrB family looped-hinge helix DNA binding protein